MGKLRSIFCVFALLVCSGAGPAAIAGARSMAPAAPYNLGLESDRLLLRLDKSKPHCRLWTDWRKLCSRTGPGGSTYCRMDEDHTVAPSTPFCATEGNLSRKELASRNRFCVRYEREYLPTDSAKATGPRHCVKHDSDRPFNGETIAVMLHPACLVWGMGEPTKPICTTEEGDRPSLPQCDSDAIRRLRIRTFIHEPFVCLKWADPPPCNDPVGGDSPIVPNEQGIWTGGSHPLNRQPVWGTYCPY